MAGQFKKAVREKIWVKVLITGPSGSGKTTAALKLATGFVKKAGGAIAAIDTENGRIRYYADEYDFCDMQLTAPYTSEKYMSAIDTAIDEGFTILIIDSISHEWLWMNDLVNSMPGNSFQNWGRAKTQHHNKFAEKIIQSPIHIIATARGKDKWITEDKNGKMQPKKVGEGSVASDDTEYNYSVTFNLAQETHIASAGKDNTKLFDGRFETITEKDGEALYDWANSGTAVKPTVKTTENITDIANDLKSIVDEIANSFKKKMADGKDKNAIYSKVEEISGTKNFMTIKDIDTAKKVLEAVNNF